MPDYIWHVILNNGGGRAMLRSEIPDAAIETMRPLIVEDGIKTIPDLGVDLVTTRERSSLYCTVKRTGRDLCAFAVAPRALHAAGLWQELHATALDDFKTDPNNHPRAPWCGIALAAALRQEPREITLGMIGLSKAIAWTWTGR